MQSKKWKTKKLMNVDFVSSLKNVMAPTLVLGPAQIAESVNDSANSSLVLGSIPTVSSRKIYFVAWLRAG